MQRALTSLFFTTLPLATLGCLISSTAKAQIAADGTTSTTVNQNGDNFMIEQGDRVGDNLFHSFNEFSVPTLGSAAFNNADNIANIFSRVTGSNISDIDGLISAKGAANLFLINPNGIIFGENARLDLGGSFFASTADSLLFEGNVEFSASNPQAPPLLEVNIPIGLNFRDNPGDIVNQSIVQNSTSEVVGLEVESGKNLTFAGGNINFETGRATARGGNIELGGLSTAGTVGISEDGSLSFPDDIAKANITLSNASEVVVQSTDGGSININARNLNLEGGEFGSSFIRGGIIANSTSPDSQAGDITINSTESVNVVDDSAISNPVLGGAIGNSGNITITTGSLFLNNGAEVFTETRSTGKAGDITINSPDINLQQGTKINASTAAQGDGGNLILNTERLKLSDGAQILAATLGLGEGGTLTVNASDSVTVTGEFINPEGLILPSLLSTQTQGAGDGSAGDLTIDTGRLIVRDGAQLSVNTDGAGTGGNLTVEAEQIELIGISAFPSGIFASTDGTGTGGNIGITSNSLFLSQGAEIVAEARSTGKAGDITINSPDISLQEATTITASTAAQGKGGNLLLNTERLELADGAQVIAATLGLGEGGTLTVNASDSVTVTGEFINPEGLILTSGLSTQTQGAGDGSAGDLTIDTGRLIVRDGAQISTDTQDAGNGGNLIVEAEQIELIGSSPLRANTPSGILSPTDGAGTGGTIGITSNSLFLSQGAEIFTETRSTGKAGDIMINSPDISLQEATKINASTAAQGDGGNLILNTERLKLSDGAQILAATLGLGEGGTLTVNAADSVTVTGEFINPEGLILTSGLSTQTQGAGDGSAGDLTIDTGRLIVRDGAQLSVNTDGAGTGGNLTVEAEQIELIGISAFPSGIFAPTDGAGTGGNIGITSNSLFLSQGAEIVAEARSTGKAGDITINSPDISLQEATTITASTAAQGDGGNLILNTERLKLSDGAQILAATLGLGEGGTLTVNASDSVTLTGSSVLSTETQGAGDGSGGDLTIDTGRLIVRDGAQINAATFGTGQAGTITILANDLVELTGTGGVFVQATNGGTAGDLDLETRDLTIADGASVTVSSPEGQAGNLKITANSLSQNEGQITAETRFNTIVNGENIGANINLEISDTWRIENESLVSATAFGDADGGNININQGLSDTEFLLFAFPPTGDRGSDITANANEGDGGRIEINAAGVFGIEFREISAAEAESNSLNDFTVSSQFGTSGETIINRTVDDPTSGLIELSQAVGDASDQISQNPCEQGVGSEFIVTGKGGLPPNVNEALNSEEAQVSLIEAVPSKQQKVEANGIPTENLTPEAVPAMGWVFNEKGEVTLTAYNPIKTGVQRSQKKPINSCSAP